jgi:hypothetical protein
VPVEAILLIEKSYILEDLAPERHKIAFDRVHVSG